MLSNCSLTRQSHLNIKIIDTTRGDAASGVSLSHENTSLRLSHMHIPPAEIKSLSEKWIAQLNLREENCFFCVEILRTWTWGMYAHSLSLLQNKTNFTFLLEGKFERYLTIQCFCVRKEGKKPPKSRWGFIFVVQ